MPVSLISRLKTSVSPSRRRNRPIAVAGTERLEDRLLLAAAAKPVLLSPSGVLHDSQPTFVWAPAANAVRYELLVNNISNGPDEVIHEEDLTSTRFTSIIPLRSGVYRFWVRSYDADDCASEWSDPLTFSILNRPVLTGPSGPTSATPTFTWAAVVGASQYDLWVRNLFTGEDQVIREQNLPTNSFTPGSPLDQGRYRFWVRAGDGTGDFGPWSDSLDFTIGADFQDSEFRFISPLPGTVTNDTTPTFQWARIVGINRWDLFVTNHSTGESQVIREENLTEPFFTPATELEPGQHQFWVRGFGPVTETLDDGTEITVDRLKIQWQDGGRFTVGAPPTILSPPPDTSDSTPTFNWTEIEDAQRYRLWLTRIGGNDPLIRRDFLFDTSFTPVSPLPDGDYRVWVRAVQANGVSTPWSDPHDFQIRSTGGAVLSAVPSVDRVMSLLSEDDTLSMLL